jgi:hypothetical protein
MTGARRDAGGAIAAEVARDATGPVAAHRASPDTQVVSGRVEAVA